jgi:anti-anti-sigma regulatory factor
MEVIAEAAFWAMVGCAVVSIVGLFVTRWRRSAAIVEAWRRLAVSPEWTTPFIGDLTVEALSVGNAALITIKGSLTVETAQAVSKCIRRLTSEGKNHLVVDMSGAPLDSQEALAPILAAAEELHDHGGGLGVVAPRQDVRFHTSLTDSASTHTYMELSDALNDLLVS